MFKLSKKTEYSILALRHLGRSSTVGAATVKEIAAACRIPAPLLAKLLQQLAKKGVVHSVQGVNGGYSLNMEMARITLADVIEAVEGPFRITACGGKEGKCNRFSFCDIKSAVAPLQSQMITYLRTVSLADLELGSHPGERK
jgi:Rrf2 family protein